MNSDLFLSILALDSYNRGYNAGVEFGPGSDQSGGKIGNATIFLNKGDSAAQAAGFYGIAYTLEVDGALKTVISYRGTDNYIPYAPGNDI